MQRLAILENFAREPSGPEARKSPGPALASMNAAQVLLQESLAPARAQRIALTCAFETLTYAELTARIARFAAGLRAAGVEPGDRVVLMMLDTPDLVALYLAVMAVGAVSVAVSTRSTPKELRHIVSIAKPCALIAADEFSRAAEQAIAEANP